MTKRKPISGSQALNQLLTQLNKIGGFTASVLTDDQGLCLAAAITGSDPEVHSALVAQVQKVASQVGKQLGMAQTDEIALNDTAGQRLICRPFQVNSHHLMLAVTIPDKSQPHRRATNQVIEAIRQTWQSYWE